MNIIGLFQKLTGKKIIGEIVSPFNGKIQVVEDLWGKRLVVNGLTQSGGEVRRIWKKALTKISISNSPMPAILILGLGGGTLASLLSQKWPEAEIVGVEIDPRMVELGKKYFALGKIPKLKIVIDDAIKFVFQLETRKRRWEAILVDLYRGDQFPPQGERKEFLTALKRTLVPKGLAVFNRLYYKKHKRQTELFLAKLKTLFYEIKKEKIGGNLLIFCWKKA